MPPSIQSRIAQRIAEELGVRPQQVAAAVQLLDEGATVPFISRYRKEVTDNLDDTQLRNLEERLNYLRELEDRRAVILSSIAEQGKLTPELQAAIDAAETKQSLEDLYLPYKQKRRTKAQIAREAGLEPLADALFADPTLTPEVEAAKYVNPQQEPAERHVPDIKAALDGARQILMERFSEDAALLAKLRSYLGDYALLVSTVVAGKEAAGAKFRDWFDFREAIKTVPSHRALALLRGRNEDILRLALKADQELRDPPESSPCVGMVSSHFAIRDEGRAADKWLQETARWAWLVKLSLHLESELMNQLRERAEEEAIRVFARNLHDLLLAAPAGLHTVIGLDPGIRTGVKVAVVDVTGKVVDTTTIYPHEPRRDWEGSLAVLRQLAQKHGAGLISIGNGTASRETDKLAAELMRRHPELKLTRIVVSEAGASVYSASELAAKEFPDLDVSLRGAVSIARRLQDPLAELVKIDPKAIGVGQYQHDVNQSRLARSLDAVVEDCVNSVGVDVNTASAALLKRISGLNATLAGNIVSYRDAHGAFKSRAELKEVPRLGDKAFEQAAGFLRVSASENLLDASAVHPEAYPVVERILRDIRRGVRELVGDAATLRTLDARKYTDERFGLPTVQDILKELEKPGRDPRPEFKAATFKEGVEELKDIQPGMLLEGVVTNVTNFGAFVDIGVHQDGLVHVSALANRFVKDPHEVVRAGDVVKVKVIEVDAARKRIALTMRLADDVPPKAASSKAPARVGASDTANRGGSAGKPAPEKREPASAGAMAAAFAKLRR
ncbi:MAG: transcriptional accessory protein containing S1 RNA-binding domain [Rhodocyclaceae bacterium]|nr:MAG: transcriptional accessory protein containing S1 RNA-binding domain [Rhodocyclaceae bacterium]TND00278.1 MAG: transcriptional accessory protein containing S1 RNA-binding domain [Rhodocyclaceae bacterium]